MSKFLDYDGLAYFKAKIDRDVTGFSYAVKVALLDIFQHVAYTDEHGQDYYDALESALFPPSSLVSIDAVFTQGSNVIYDNASLDSLKQYLVVTATYDDSSQGVIPSTGYALSGTLTAGTSTITAIYGNKSDEFDVIVTHATVQYTITNNLTQCSNSNSATVINEQTAYSGTLTPSSGYVLETVTVTMGGTDITSTAYSAGTISIASVTGNIVITAVATEDVGWRSGVPYDLSESVIGVQLINGEESTYSSFAASPFLPAKGAFIISSAAFGKNDSAIYDNTQQFISLPDIAIPAGTKPICYGGDYLRVSAAKNTVLNATITPYRLPILNDTTVIAASTWYTYTPIVGIEINDTTGREISHASYDSSDYLNCYGMTEVLINRKGGTWGSVTFYDGNKEFISGVAKTNQSSWDTATPVPSGARYVRICGGTGIKLAIKYE